jgi:uncharacterized phiE125 gp8 family phage protein
VSTVQSSSILWGLGAPTNSNWTYVYTRQIAAEPAVEVLAAADVKDQLRVDYTDEDAYITGLIIAARNYAETVMNRQLITATWNVYLDRFPRETVLLLPLGRLQALNSLIYTLVDGTTQTWTPSGSNLIDANGAIRAHVDNKREPCRLVLPFGSPIWPPDVLLTSNPVAINLTCGYGDTGDKVPASIQHAMKLLIAHWFNNREAVIYGKTTAIGSKELELAFRDILANYILPSFG